MLSGGAWIFFQFPNSEYWFVTAFKGLIMIVSGKKVFSNHQTWHMAHVAQLAAPAQSHTHTQP